MFDIFKDIGNIWSRLFDHRAFLGGEIQLLIRELESKRSDREVEQLFNVIEPITDIKDRGVKKLTDIDLLEVNEELNNCLLTCKQIFSLEESFKENTHLENSKQKRKSDLNTFMDDITSKYSEINASVEEKEKELDNYYSELEKRLQ